MRSDEILSRLRQLCSVSERAVELLEQDAITRQAASILS